MWEHPQQYIGKRGNQPTQGGKEFSYDHIMREVVTFAKSTDSRINIRMIPQRRALKGILLLFIEPYAAAARDLEKCINPDITKVTVNGSPNKAYNNGIEAKNLCAGDQPVPSAQKSFQQNGPPMVLHRQQVPVIYRPSLHGGHQKARKWSPVLLTPQTLCSLRYTERHLAREL